MPYVFIEVLEGKTVDQKRDVAKKVTEAVSEGFGVPPRAVAVIFKDIPNENLSIEGQLIVDRK